MERVIDLNRWQREHVKSEQELQQVFFDVRSLYYSEPYSDYSSRVKRLNRLKKALLEYQDDLVEALTLDYGFRSEFDSLICDILPAVSHINYTLKHLRKWMKPNRRHAGLLLAPSRVKVEFQPLGVVGVIVPWNFPIVLSIAPVVTAIAAGNRVMVKLSEYTPRTNQVLSQIFKVIEQHVHTIEGETEIAEYFSRLPFNHLIFTGSTKVGRLVAQAAANNLTPVTLELGGKSPVIVGNDAEIDKAVDAVMLGKAVNAGQICVAPDYVMVPQGKELTFIHTYLRRYKEHFVKHDKAHGVTHIINDIQWARLQNLLQDARSKGASIHTLDDVIVEGRQMMPHLVTGVTEDMLVMQEEIFGPILPVMGYRQLNEAYNYINLRPHPLALYLISDDKITQRQIIEQTHSGGVAINDTLLHVAAEDAPFGGVGESGIGRYHGIEGFQTFSHAKTVLVTPSWLPRSKWLLRFKEWAVKALDIFFIR